MLCPIVIRRFVPNADKPSDSIGARIYSEKVGRPMRRFFRRLNDKRRTAILRKTVNGTGTCWPTVQRFAPS